MAQTWDIPQNLEAAKAVDYALVIAGWPTVYTVARTHDLPGTGLLSTAKGFAPKTQPWASLPRPAEVGTVGRPEEGICSIGMVRVDLLDRRSGGRRGITDLCSAHARAEDDSSYPRSPLYGGPLDEETTVVSVVSGDSFPSAGEVFLGGECIRYEAKMAGPFGSTTLLDCTRGHRMTTATRHQDAATVYTAMPSLYLREAYLFKGYQDLTLDQWKPAFGGVIAGVSRNGPVVHFLLSDTMWLLDLDLEQRLLGPPAERTNDAQGVVSNGVFRPARLAENAFTTGEDEIAIEADNADGLGSGHYLVVLGESWLGIKEAV